MIEELVMEKDARREVDFLLAFFQNKQKTGEHFLPQTKIGKECDIVTCTDILLINGMGRGRQRSKSSCVT